MDLNKLIGIIGVVQPQIALGLEVVNLVITGIKHLQNTGEQTIPPELEQKILDATARQKRVNDEYDGILNG